MVWILHDCEFDLWILEMVLVRRRLPFDSRLRLAVPVPGRVAGHEAIQCFVGEDFVAAGRGMDGIPEKEFVRITTGC